MHKLDATPAPCLCCGRGNTSDERDPVAFVDLERDINWNDPAIICEDCIAQAGALVGMMSTDSAQEFKVLLKGKDKEIHELQVKLQSYEKRARKLGIKFVEPATV